MYPLPCALLHEAVFRIATEDFKLLKLWQVRQIRDRILPSRKIAWIKAELRFAICKPTFMMTYHLAISSQFNWHNMVVIEFLPQLVWYLKLITLVLHLV